MYKQKLQPHIPPFVDLLYGHILVELLGVDVDQKAQYGKNWKAIWDVRQPKIKSSEREDVIEV